MVTNQGPIFATGTNSSDMGSRIPYSNRVAWNNPAMVIIYHSQHHLGAISPSWRDKMGTEALSGGESLWHPAILRDIAPCVNDAVAFFVPISSVNRTATSVNSPILVIWHPFYWHGSTLSQHAQAAVFIMQCEMKLLATLEFGNWYVMSFHTLPNICLRSYAGM